MSCLMRLVCAIVTVHNILSAIAYRYDYVCASVSVYVYMYSLLAISLFSLLFAFLIKLNLTKPVDFQ